jgi:type IV secretion system protein TrbE
MLPALLVGISGVGMGLCLLLLSQVRAVSRVASLKRHRSGAPGVADLLNYAAVVDDGVIICKNGSLSGAFLFEGKDDASSTGPEREAVSAWVNKAFRDLGSGWMLHVDAIRKPAPGYIPAKCSHFPDRVTRMIDEERRRLFEGQGNVYEGRFVLIVTYQPPAEAIRQVGNLMFDDDCPPPDAGQVAQTTLARFNREVAALETRLSSVFRTQRLGVRREMTEHGEAVYDDFLAHLQRCVTGLDHPIRLPRTPVLLDALIGGQELRGGSLPQIGRQYVQVVAIDGFPSESSPGMLTALGELPVAYRWSTRFIFLDSWQAVSHLEKFRRRWQQQVVPFMAQVLRFPSRNVNEDAQLMANDATAAKVGFASGVVSAGYYTSVVILMDENREAVEESARHVERTINRLGFTARIETLNTMEAFLGSLPGHGVENIRRPLVNTMNLADFLPVSSIWTGEAQCPCPFYPEGSPPLAYGVTTGRTRFRINLHVQDIAHSLVFGPTGAGKSSWLAFLSAQLRRYPRMSIFAFDKGMSLYAITKASGGVHYHVAGDGDQLAFCPLQHLETKQDRAWAAEWVKQILTLNKVEVSPERTAEIWESVESLHKAGHRTLSDFVTTIQDREIRQALLDYTMAGAMGSMFDAEADSLGDLGGFVTFEIEELMQLSERFALPILLYLFRRIERSLRGQPAAIILDECWLMLGHPVFSAKIREWLKTMRKANCGVIMATQSLSDASRSGLLDVLDESTATKVFLPNSSAHQDDAAALYRRFGLNEADIAILSESVPKRDYYVVSEKGRRLINLELGPVALAFVGVSSKDDVAQVKRFEARHGERWADEWMALKTKQKTERLVCA